MAIADLSPAPGSYQMLLPPANDLHARFSREAFHRMIDAGVIDPESHVELVDGEIFMMLPIGPPHGGFSSRLYEFFVRRLPESLQCRAQIPIVAGNHSEPQPDLAIVRRRDDDYQNEHPSPNDVLLIVEVADTSLSFDLGPKLRLYAASGIPEYWVVDIQQKSIHVYRSLAGTSYSNVSTLRSGETIEPLAAPTCQLAVDWLFR